MCSGGRPSSRDAESRSNGPVRARGRDARNELGYRHAKRKSLRAATPMMRLPRLLATLLAPVLLGWFGRQYLLSAVESEAFNTRPAGVVTPDLLGVRSQQFSFASGDRALRGSYVPAREESAPAVLIFSRGRREHFGLGRCAEKPLHGEHIFLRVRLQRLWREHRHAQCPEPSPGWTCSVLALLATHATEWPALCIRVLARHRGAAGRRERSATAAGRRRPCRSIRIRA